MCDHRTIDWNSTRDIRAYLKFARWDEISDLRLKWTPYVRKTWIQVFVRETLKAPYRLTFWIDQLQRAQRAIRIEPRGVSQWPTESRRHLLNCLFVFRGARVILSGLSCVKVCDEQRLCPSELGVLIQQFIGTSPVSM